MGEWPTRCLLKECFLIISFLLFIFKNWILYNLKKKWSSMVVEFLHGDSGVGVPPAVNWHCEATCNYGCKFCYARFTEQQLLPRMTEAEGIVLLRSVSEAGVAKVNFVGGEPMLHPHLRAWIVEAKRLGMTTSIVSNGTRMTRKWLEEMTPYLDWLGLSIDASNDALHAAMGRGRRGELQNNTSRHLERCREVIQYAKELGYGIKLNTVVSSVNAMDDMSELVRQWRPHRWKIFQALPIAGENDDEMASLEVSPSLFTSYVSRHQRLLRDCTDVDIVGEDNDAMRGTYAMIDPLGLVYTNAEGRYLFSSSPVHLIGFQQAWDQVSGGWSREQFVERDGNWDWTPPSESLDPQQHERYPARKGEASA